MQSEPKVCVFELYVSFTILICNHATTGRPLCIILHCVVTLVRFYTIVAAAN